MVRDHNGQHVYFEDEPGRRSAVKSRTIHTEQTVGKASGQMISRTNNTIIAANTANPIHGDGISMHHDFVVIIERSRRTLCTGRHYWWCVG